MTRRVLSAFLLDAVVRSPERPALHVCGGGSYTYRELHGRAMLYAARLLERHGWRKGERVGILVEDDAERVFAYWGALLAGQVAIVIASDFSAETVRYLVSHAGIATLVADDATMQLARRAVPESSLVLHARDVAGEPSRDVRLPTVISQDLAGIVYTSGSTGAPKGVTLSHLNMVAAADSIGEYLDYRAEDVVFCGLPLSFDY
jgi:acyl-CoA synthetase (AMP-forming)/AMP-acid ligase II